MTEKDGTSFKGEPIVLKTIIKCYGEADGFEAGKNYSRKTKLK